MNGYNFTEAVRLSLARAREEASRLGHEYVGTEHELLGLLAAAPNVATSILEARQVAPTNVRTRIESIVKWGKDRDHGRDMPYTSRAKKALELAMTEARDLGHNHVDCGHLLLGIMREEKGIAAQVLHEAGLDIDAARSAFLALEPAGTMDPPGEKPRYSTLSSAAAAAMLRVMAETPNIARVFAAHEIDLPTLIDDVGNADG